MPSNKKTLPNARKRVTASARARVSVRKIKKTHTQLDGSYLEPRNNEIVSTAPAAHQTPSSNVPSTNDAIMMMLQEIKDSNTALCRRMDKVEQSSLRSTPLNSRSHPQGLPSHSSQTGSPQLNPTSGVGGGQIRDPLTLADFRHDQGHLAARPALPHLQDVQQEPQLRPILHAPPQPQGTERLQMDRRDAVIPNLQSLRQNPVISHAVNDLLATYDGRAQQELSQGKPQSAKRSGRFNTHDTIATQPQLRWPNEGFHASSGKKRLTYDELSLPQWVAGQLTNIYAITDPGLMKQAILQMTLAIRDATSLPWPAVRAAWASSMHEIEDGTLTWANSTQWAINRLSASQIALAQPQTSAISSTSKRPCRYYNDATCSHEGHHGPYAHICAFCYKQGKQFAHPEHKCNGKHRQSNKPQQSNS